MPDKLLLFVVYIFVFLVNTTYTQLDYGIYWNGIVQYQMNGLCPTGSKTTSTLVGYHGYQFKPDNLVNNVPNYKFNQSVHCFINIQGPNIWDQYQTQAQLIDIYLHYATFGTTNCSYAYIKVYQSAACTFGSTDLSLLAQYCGAKSFSASQRDIDPIATRCVQLEIFIANTTNWINVTALPSPVSVTGLTLTCDYTLSTIYQKINNSCFYNEQNDNTVDFLIDVSSYYNGLCNSSYINNKYEFQCAPPSTTMRCIHYAFRCNGYLLRGCKDFATNFINEPSFCGTSTPTIDLLPLWIVLGILGGIIASYIPYWLLWRTGWLIWHLSRIRHYKCVNKILQCCKRMRCCSKCSSCCKSIAMKSACCKAMCDCCEKCCNGKNGRIGNNINPNTGWSRQPKYKPSDFDSNNNNNSGSSHGIDDGLWMNWYQGDGGHLRELRF